jgi:hypothetical protein
MATRLLSSVARLKDSPVCEITASSLKKFSNLREVRDAVARVKAAIEVAERTCAHVDSYLEPAFERFHFTDEEGQPVIDRKDLYLSEDEVRCAEWYALCDQLHAAHGYTGLEPGQCPALTARTARIKAENALMRLIEGFLEVGPVNNLDLRARLIDIFLKPPVK